jgi:hypothetical protein
MGNIQALLNLHPYFFFLPKKLSVAKFIRRHWNTCVFPQIEKIELCSVTPLTFSGLEEGIDI